MVLAETEVAADGIEGGGEGEDGSRVAGCGASR